MVVESWASWNVEYTYLDYLRDYNIMLKESVSWSSDNENKFLWRNKAR